MMREGLQQLLMVAAVVLAHFLHLLPELLARLLALLYQQVNLAFDLALAVQNPAEQGRQRYCKTSEGYQR